MADTRKCSGRCGRRAGRDAEAGLCDTCRDRLPNDLRSALADSETQYGIDAAARRWLRENPAPR